MKKLILIGLVSTTLALSACVSDQHKKSATGAGIGAILGGLTGSQLGNKSKKNVVLGAVAGALAGGAVGHYMDKQEQEMKARLKREEEAQLLQISQIGDNILKVGVASDASFAIGKSDLTPQAQDIFSTIAAVVADYDETIVHVVGHTDNTGGKDLNLRLSHERAETVAQFIKQHSINNAGRVVTWGRGDNEPIASNDTEAGRTQNRRVDIVIKPVIEGQEAEALAAPPYLGR